MPKPRTWQRRLECYVDDLTAEKAHDIAKRLGISTSAWISMLVHQQIALVEIEYERQQRIVVAGAATVTARLLKERCGTDWTAAKQIAEQESER